MSREQQALGQQIFWFDMSWLFFLNMSLHSIKLVLQYFMNFYCHIVQNDRNCPNFIIDWQSHVFLVRLYDEDPLMIAIKKIIMLLITSLSSMI